MEFSEQMGPPGVFLFKKNWARNDKPFIHSDGSTTMSGFRASIAHHEDQSLD